MLLGQAEEVPTGIMAAAGGIVGGIGTAAINALAALKNAVAGGGDVQSEAQADEPYIPETPSDVTGSIGSGKTTARQPRAEYGDEGYYSPGTNGGASLWPWLLGVGLIAGGAYWFVKRRGKKRRK